MTQGIFNLDQHLAARTRAESEVKPVRAVVLAGGRGTRLAPYTSILPKPLMPIGDRSILEVVLGQLRTQDIRHVTLCVGYLSHLIEAVLANGASRGVEISYVHEEDALGTAAPLRMVESLTSTFITMNGDVLTTLDFRDLIRHHREHGNIVTIATRERPIKINYGVLYTGSNGSSGRVQRWVEKPELMSTVSMGIYVVEPEALDYIPEHGYFDFPDLVQALLAAREPVGAYKYDGMWFDIGRPQDYEQAVAAWLDGNEAVVRAQSRDALAASP